MAIEEFWGNLRTAASLLAPTATTDSSRIDAGSVQRMIAGAALWLTPRAVRGFDLMDFEFLGESDRKALERNVKRFRAVAEKVPSDKPATTAQTDDARAAFEGIVKVLKFDKFRDAESFRTQVLLDRELQGQLPEWVTGVSCETGTDLSGDPAVWVWLDVTDDATDKRLVAKNWSGIEDKVVAAYRDTGGRRWPFVRFRSPDASERRTGGAA